MLTAVERGKADWLFRKEAFDMGNLKHRPQEDMVTSAIFGTLDILPNKYKNQALILLTGENFFKLLDVKQNEEIKVSLWKKYYGTIGHRYVEPDVIISADNRALIVEVKWHAPLRRAQLELQCQAVKEKSDLRGLLLLGSTGGETDMNGLPTQAKCRSWQDVTRALLEYERNLPDGTLGRWCHSLSGFLQATSKGRIFSGFNPHFLKVVYELNTSYLTNRSWFRDLEEIKECTLRLERI